MFGFFKSRRPELIKLTEPAVEPVTSDEVKEFLRISGDAENNTINDLIRSARIEAEKFMRISLIKQKWRLAYSCTPEMEVDLPMGPVSSVDAVTLVDKDGNETEFSSANYYLSPARYFLFFDVLPSAKFIHIDYFAGYGETANDVPQAIKTGLLNQIVHRYENRGKAEISPAAREVYNLYRRIIL